MFRARTTFGDSRTAYITGFSRVEAGAVPAGVRAVDGCVARQPPENHSFLYAVLTLVVIIGSMMYMIEGEQNGFTSIPRAIYWAIVTLTTVGYGDIAPATPIGQALAAVVMIMGYGIIAVPTGIVTAELSQAKMRTVTTQACPHCSAEGHDADALFANAVAKNFSRLSAAASH